MRTIQWPWTPSFSMSVALRGACQRACKHMEPAGCHCQVQHGLYQNACQKLAKVMILRAALMGHLSANDLDHHNNMTERASWHFLPHDCCAKLSDVGKESMAWLDECIPKMHNNTASCMYPLAVYIVAWNPTIPAAIGAWLIWLRECNDIIQQFKAAFQGRWQSLYV